MKGSRLLLGCLILLLVAGAGAIALRKTIVEQAAAWWLAGLEVPAGGLTVDQLDHRRIVLTGVSLGPADVLSIGSAEVTYALSDLMSGRIGSVRIDDLRIVVDLERNPGQLDDLIALYRRTRARLPAQASGAAVAVPPIELENGRISLTTGLGSADLRFRAAAGEESGDLTLEVELAAGRLDSPAAALKDITGPISVAIGPDGGLVLASDLNTAEVALATDRPGPFAMKAALDASLDGDRSGLDASVTLSAPETGVEMRADTRLTGLEQQPEGSLAIEGRLDASGTAWNAVERLAGGSGALSFGFDGAVRLDPAVAGTSTPPDEGPLVQIDGTGRLAAEALVVPGLVRATAEAVSFDLAATEDTLRLRLQPGALVTVVPQNALLAGLPPEAVDLLGKEVTLDLSDSAVRLFRAAPGDRAVRWQADLNPRIDLRASEAVRATLTADAILEAGETVRVTELEGRTDLAVSGLSASLPGLEADDVEAELAIGFSGNDRTLQATLLQPGTLKAGTVAATGVRTQTPVTLVLAGGAMSASALETPAPLFSASLDIEPATPIRARLEARDGPDRSVAARLRAVHLEGSGGRGACTNASATIGDATLETDETAVEFLDTRFTLSHGCPDAGLLASASIGSVRHAEVAPLMEPVSVRANLTDRDDGYAIDGTVTLTDGTELFVVQGGTTADGSTGEIAFTRTAPIVFAAGGLTPARISAAFGDLKKVRGQVDGSARYRWSPDGADSDARLDIRDLSFDFGAVTVRGLDLDLALQPLWPPATPSPQSIAIARIDVGTALEDIRIGYTILPAQTPQIRINSLDGRFLGGTLSLTPFTVDPAQTRTTTTLSVAGLDMTALAELTKLDGLDVTGRLNGEIPLVLEDGAFVIRDGRLDAAGPGKLSYRSEKAAELLRGQGTEIDLMLQALKDFRYESLGMNLAKTATDDLTLKLSLLGSNPDVLDGHPFRINLNLTSQITPILDALATAYRMSREALERVWTIR